MKRSIADLIAELRSIDEHHRLEVKRSWSGDADATISAFSNDDGGTILIGVWRPDGGTYEVVGVRDPDQVQNEITTALSSNKFNRPIRPRISVEMVEGKAVVAVEIFEARAADKPIYVSKQGTPKGAYRRIGSADVVCSDDDIRMFHRRADDQPFEDTIAFDATMDDLGDDVIAKYRRSLIDVNPATETRDYSVHEFVEALGGARRVDGVLLPTIAGVLLFAKPIALRRLFPLVRVDYIRVRGVEWLDDSEQRYESIDVRQPLLLAFRQIYQAILDDLPRSVEVRSGSPERVESPTVPEVVIREALVNALCHRDYRVNSPIQVIRYNNRIEFRNAGHSLVSPEVLGSSGSESRNPHIADVFRDMRLAENKGAGVRIMRREMQNARLSQPSFESDRANNRFVATLHFTHLLSEAQRDWLASLHAGPFSHEESIALVQCREAGEIRNATLRELTRLDTLKASNLLRVLCDRGLLVAQGAGTATSYVLVPPQPGQGELFGDEPASKTGKPSKTGKSGSRMGKSAASEAGKPSRTGKSSKTGNLETGKSSKTGNPETGKSRATPEDREALLAGLPGSLRDRLQGQLPHGDRIRSLIVELCAVRPFSRAALAMLLRRKKPGHLSEEHLAPMVAAGVLEMTIPDKPNAPQQAYRTRRTQD